ncbi:MAG: helix-hairpin-helix domain-containing protein [Gemmatimonadota bacterium]|nr:helix-hairpin-helix domain-containing protein [Gemmatimonadota bacterium]
MATRTDLQEIPGVGPSMRRCLEDLGIHAIRDLEGLDPAELYVRSNDLHGYQDRCVLYSFRCAVYYAETRRPDPELLKWWNWKDRTHANERVVA